MRPEHARAGKSRLNCAAVMGKHGSPGPVHGITFSEFPAVLHRSASARTSTAVARSRSSSATVGSSTSARATVVTASCAGRGSVERPEGLLELVKQRRPQRLDWCRRRAQDQLGEVCVPRCRVRLPPPGEPLDEGARLSDSRSGTTPCTREARRVAANRAADGCGRHGPEVRAVGLELRTRGEEGVQALQLGREPGSEPAVLDGRDVRGILERRPPTGRRARGGGNCHDR